MVHDEDEHWYSLWPATHSSLWVISRDGLARHLGERQLQRVASRKPGGPLGGPAVVLDDPGGGRVVDLGPEDHPYPVPVDWDPFRTQRPRSMPVRNAHECSNPPNL